MVEVGSVEDGDAVLLAVRAEDREVEIPVPERVVPGGDLEHDVLGAVDEHGPDVGFLSPVHRIVQVQADGARAIEMLDTHVQPEQPNISGVQPGRVVPGIRAVNGEVSNTAAPRYGHVENVSGRAEEPDAVPAGPVVVKDGGHVSVTLDADRDTGR